MELPNLTEPCSMTASIVSDETLRHRFNILKKTNQQTKELNFSLFNQDKERLDHWLRNLEPHLMRCNTIKMKMPFSFSDKVMISASRALYKLPHLKALKVNAMASAQISNKGLIALNQTLSKLQKLASLKLDFSRCPKITDQGLTNLGQSIYRLPNLTSLTLIFSGCDKITNDSLIKLGGKIAKLSQLTELKLIFNNCPEITDEGVSRLFKSISSLKDLTHLTYKFYRCSLTDISITAVGADIQNLTNLKRFSLTVSSGNKTSMKGITPEGTYALTENFHKLQNLESLTMKFGWSSTLSDQALYCLNQGLIQAAKLKSLQIGLYYCDEITDSGVRVLTQDLHKLYLLESFKINLWTCNNLTDDVFIDLSWDLARLSGLRKCRLASERQGWQIFDKKSLLSFALGQSTKRLAKKVYNNKMTVFLMFGLLLVLLSLLAPVLRAVGINEF